MAMPVETIRAVVDKIVFRKADDGWCIMRTDRGSVKGCVPWEAKPGDALKLEGSWKKSAYNGADEFIFKTAMIDVPESRRALLTYAVSITDGMGDVMEEKIWARYGAEWPDARDLDIKGLTAKARDCWGDTLDRIRDQREQAQAVAFLVEHGCTLNMAAAAWGKWEVATVSVVNADPFQLASLPRYGFVAVDSGIRQTFQISDEDPRRAAAAVRYMLDENARNGNTLAGLAWLEQRLATVCPVASATLGRVLDGLVQAGAVTISGQFVARAEDFQHETAIWRRYEKKGTADAV